MYAKEKKEREMKEKNEKCLERQKEKKKNKNIVKYFFRKIVVFYSY